MKQSKIYRIVIACMYASVILFFACEETPEINRVPDVNTILVSNVDENSAIVQAEVIGGGGYRVDRRGVCYSSSNSNPSDKDMVIWDSNEDLGKFALSLTNLYSGKEYYVRAFAENYEGWGYGEVLSFKTMNSIPTLTTSSIIDITSNSAVSGGNILNDGGCSVTARGVCWSESSNPTLLDNYTNDGTGSDTYKSSLTDLTEWSTYYVRAYATNIKGTAYGNEVSFVARNTIADYDGNRYKTVKIGNQIWMAENLKTTHYTNGTEITLVESNTSWELLGYTDIAMCYYNNSTTNGEIYGALYTWDAAMNGVASSRANPSGIQGVCPDGWHLPSDIEWIELTEYLGGLSVAGGKMKEIGTTYWDSPNTGATNESGFAALSGGYRSLGGMFEQEGLSTGFWSATEDDYRDAWRYMLLYNSSEVNRTNYYKDNGHSVRCVKD